MAKAINKAYLLTQLKGYDTNVAQPEFTVGLNAKTAPNTGYAKTYQITQGKEADGSAKVVGEIDIPKDFFLKDASVKVCDTPDTPVAGLVVGDKYIDLEVNIADGTETSKHNYIAIKDVIKAYSVEQNAAVIQLSISADNTISATIKDASIARAKIDATFEKNIADLEATHAKDDAGDYKSVATEISDKVGALGDDKDGNPYATVKAYVDDKVTDAVTEFETDNIDFNTEW